MSDTVKKDPLKKIIGRFQEERAIKVETSIKFFVMPKPKYLPKFLWRWLLRSLVHVEVVDKFL